MSVRLSRWFVLIAGLSLCVPLAAGLLQPSGNGRSGDEARPLSPWPGFPSHARDWRALPKALDAFVADRFGLREAMIHWQSAIAYRWLREANPDVLIGRHARLFYYGDDAIAQSAGETVRPEAIRHTVDVVTTMRQVLAARGVKLVVASPPNAASIYDEDLPGWARNPGRETEPDLILKHLKARGVDVVDLRQILRAARDRGSLYYHTDTHWTMLGAFIAYSAIVTAVGHADWVLPPSRVVTRLAPFDTGDLARMLGAGKTLGEMMPAWTIPDVTIKAAGPPDAPFEVSPGVAGGPAVLIVGDSFSEITFATLAAGHAGRIGWLNNRNCDFDWSWIDSFKPDEVWWVPTERLILCRQGSWPKGMPRPVDPGHRAGQSATGPARPG